jgi:hypothetical protein
MISIFFVIIRVIYSFLRYVKLSITDSHKDVNDHAFKDYVSQCLNFVF